MASQLDIRDVSIVASCRSREEARFVQQLMIACGLSSYITKSDLRTTIEALVTTKPDAALLVMDRDIERMEEFFKTVRAPEFAGNRYLPVIVAQWQPSVVEIKQAIAIGASEIVSLPTNTDAMTRAIYRAIFVGRPFIEVESYFGPCRRRKQIKNYGCRDRRKTEWEYSHVSVRQVSLIDS